jgi:hypothetical protein
MNTTLSDRNIIELALVFVFVAAPGGEATVAVGAGVDKVARLESTL